MDLLMLSKWNFRGGDLVKDAELIEYCKTTKPSCGMCPYEYSCYEFTKRNDGKFPWQINACEHEKAD